MPTSRIPLTFTSNGVNYGFWGSDRLYKADIAAACGFTRGTAVDMADTTQQRGDLPCYEVRCVAEGAAVAGVIPKKTFILKVAPDAADTALQALGGKTLNDRDENPWIVHRVRPKTN
jgi:hypothetical protein